MLGTAAAVLLLAAQAAYATGVYITMWVARSVGPSVSTGDFCI